MKKYLTILAVLFCNVVMAQDSAKYKPTLMDTIYTRLPFYIDQKTKTIGIDGKVLYGTAGIQFDSAKYYYKRYLKLKNKGVPDSNNKYKTLLQKYISK